MDCPAKKHGGMEILLDHCARRLDPAAAAEVERHAAGCRECARVIAAQREVWRALDAWEAPAAPPDFDRRLWARIDAAGQASWWRSLRWRPALSFSLAGLLLLAAAVIERPKPAAPPQQAQVETLDADRIEKALDDLDMLRQLNLGADEPKAM